MTISQISTSIQPPTETFEVISSIDVLSDQLGFVSQKKITGQLILKIQGTRLHQWSLYFYLGQLIWATDQMHPIRRWYRQLALHCPRLASDPIGQTRNSSQPWNDAALARLVRRGKIRQQDGEAIVTGHMREILFDIFQQWTQIRSRPDLQMTYRYIHQSEVDLPFATTPVERVWLQSMSDWEVWRRAGLGNYSPNQAPLLWQVESLRQKLSPMAYQNLAALVDGRRTLRDLAVKSRQDLLLMTQSLIPHVHQGAIRLVAVEDLQSSFQSFATPPLKKASSSLPIRSVRPVSGYLPSSLIRQASDSRPISSVRDVSSALSLRSVSPRAPSPLVAHIDDHILHGKMMGHILAHLNYRFIHLQDPVNALMNLLEHKPNLIFLDLAMPIINGYELCAQIRRVSTFKDTPIIIVSSNDGVVDRIQAKNVGGSDFLAKPIRLKNVQTLLQRHIVH